MTARARPPAPKMGLRPESPSPDTAPAAQATKRSRMEPEAPARGAAGSRRARGLATTPQPCGGSWPGRGRSRRPRRSTPPRAWRSPTRGPAATSQSPSGQLPGGARRPRPAAPAWRGGGGSPRSRSRTPPSPRSGRQSPPPQRHRDGHRGQGSDAASGQAAEEPPVSRQPRRGSGQRSGGIAGPAQELPSDGAARPPAREELPLSRSGQASDGVAELVIDPPGQPTSMGKTAGGGVCEATGSPAGVDREFWDLLRERLFGDPAAPRKLPPYAEARKLLRSDPRWRAVGSQESRQRLYATASLEAAERWSAVKQEPGGEDAQQAATKAAEDCATAEARPARQEKVPLQARHIASSASSEQPLSSTRAASKGAEGGATLQARRAAPGAPSDQPAASASKTAEGDMTLQAIRAVPDASSEPPTASSRPADEGTEGKSIDAAQLAKEQRARWQAGPTAPGIPSEAQEHLRTVGTVAKSGEGGAVEPARRGRRQGTLQQAGHTALGSAAETHKRTASVEAAVEEADNGAADIARPQRHSKASRSALPSALCTTSEAQANFASSELVDETVGDDIVEVARPSGQREALERSLGASKAWRRTNVDTVEAGAAEVARPEAQTRDGNAEALTKSCEGDATKATQPGKRQEAPQRSQLALLRTPSDEHERSFGAKVAVKHTVGCLTEAARPGRLQESQQPIQHAVLDISSHEESRGANAGIVVQGADDYAAKATRRRLGWWQLAPQHLQHADPSHSSDRKECSISVEAVVETVEAAQLRKQQLAPQQARHLALGVSAEVQKRSMSVEAVAGNGEEDAAEAAQTNRRQEARRVAHGTCSPEAPADPTGFRRATRASGHGRAPGAVRGELATQRARAEGRRRTPTDAGEAAGGVAPGLEGCARSSRQDKVWRDTTPPPGRHLPLPLRRRGSAIEIDDSGSDPGCRELPRASGETRAGGEAMSEALGAAAGASRRRCRAAAARGDGGGLATTTHARRATSEAPAGPVAGKAPDSLTSWGRIASWMRQRRVALAGQAQLAEPRARSAAKRWPHAGGEVRRGWTGAAMAQVLAPGLAVACQASVGSGMVWRCWNGGALAWLRTEHAQYDGSEGNADREGTQSCDAEANHASGLRAAARPEPLSRGARLLRIRASPRAAGREWLVAAALILAQELRYLLPGEGARAHLAAGSEAGSEGGAEAEVLVFRGTSAFRLPMAPQARWKRVSVRRANRPTGALTPPVTKGYVSWRLSMANFLSLVASRGARCGFEANVAGAAQDSAEDDPMGDVEVERLGVQFSVQAIVNTQHQFIKDKSRWLESRTVLQVRAELAILDGNGRGELPGDLVGVAAGLRAKLGAEYIGPGSFAILQRCAAGWEKEAR
ncbi:unnamed protein product [Prorocentrum cordatum]|uniref:Uncharacterized protein n=1 Tax=Prorocentrum cordatum TaxID=2364126 RepID=A0ABN9STN4_9DINO|nr:unnamed protein product [Polarella glacialis]